MAEPTNLTTIIAAHSMSEIGGRRLLCNCGWITRQADYPAAEREYASHVAAALRESRTVRTVEELDALPVGSIVVEPIGHAWIKHDPYLWHCSCGTDVEWASSLLVLDSHLPLQVVYRHDEGGAQ